jgi:Zn-dependent peptidase ImmA (M78 family)
MDRNTYYEELKDLARSKRAIYGVKTEAFGLREVRSIYKAEGIRLDTWPELPKRVKAMYMCDDNDFSVAIQPKLPEEPCLFALVHELKHHYCDQDLINDGFFACGDYNVNELVEIGAEVFAAEFIYPEAEFAVDILRLKVMSWQKEDVVRLKRECKAKVSYMFLVKRLTRLGLVQKGQFEKVQFKKLEEEMFGVPLYRRHTAGRR